MIVTDDDGRAVANNSWAKYFGRAQYRAIDRPLIAIDILHDLVFCIEYQDAHLLMVKLHHFWHGGVPIVPLAGNSSTNCGISWRHASGRRHDRGMVSALAAAVQ